MKLLHNTLERFEKVLPELMGPMRDQLDAGVFLAGNGGIRWLVRPDGMEIPPSDSQLAPLPVEMIDDGGDFESIGSCLKDDGSESDAALRPLRRMSVDALIQAAVSQSILEQDRDALCEELDLSFESLSSMYEIGADAESFRDPRRAMSRVLGRLASYHSDENVQTAIWWREQNAMTALQWHASETPPDLPLDHPALSRCIAETRGFVVQRSGDQEWMEHAPFEQAEVVAVVPLKTGDNDEAGVLAAWCPEPVDFDSRFMNLMTALSNQVAIILHECNLREELLRNEGFMKEMEIGGQIQQNLLFGAPPLDVTNIEIGTLAESSRQIAGDFFGFFRHDRQRLDLIVGDVMGKGMPAALIGAAVKSEFLRFSNSTHASGRSIPAADPASIVAAAHEALLARLQKLSSFVTACYMRIEPTRGSIRYVDCGHTPTLHYRSRFNDVIEMRCDWKGTINLPLGLSSETVYHDLETTISAGDVLLFYSDGITEATSPDGEMFGFERLKELLEQASQSSAQEIVEFLGTKVHEFTGGELLDDDMTCVAVRIPPEAEHFRSYFLEVSGAKGNLSAVRRFLAECCIGIEWFQEDASRLEQLKVAITEAIANVVRHGYSDENGGKIRVEIENDDRSISIHVLDSGPTYDPYEAPRPDLDNPKGHGLGIYMIRQLVDDLHHEPRPGGGNHLTLVKRFTQEA